VETLSILLAGTGFWGNEWLGVLARAEGVVIGATAGHRDPELPEDAVLADGYRHFDDYRTAIEESGADALLVTLPTHLHADAITRAVEAGMHVLCEKPLAEDEESAERLLAVAEAHPELVVMVSQNYRWRPWAQATRAAIEDGAVGRVAHISLRFSQPEFLAGQRLEQDNPLVEDMAIHHFDLLRFLAGGDAVEVYARQHTPPWNRFPGSPALDAVIVMDNGVQVSYSGTWAGRGGVTLWDGDYAIQGERGLLTVVDGELSLLPDAGVVDTSGKGAIAAPDPIAIAVADVPFGDTRASFEEFRRAIREGGDAATGIRDNARSIAIVFAVQESLRSGRPVQVPSFNNHRRPQGVTTR
jgi:predicted dehydrogenase